MIVIGEVFFLKDIEVLGEKIDSMVVNDFKLCREGGDFYFINPKVTNFFKRYYCTRSYFNRRKVHRM